MNPFLPVLRKWQAYKLHDIVTKRTRKNEPNEVISNCVQYSFAETGVFLYGDKNTGKTSTVEYFLEHPENHSEIDPPILIRIDVPSEELQGQDASTICGGIIKKLITSLAEETQNFLLQLNAKFDADKQNEDYVEARGKYEDFFKFLGKFKIKTKSFAQLQSDYDTIIAAFPKKGTKAISLSSYLWNRFIFAVNFGKINNARRAPSKKTAQMTKSQNFFTYLMATRFMNKSLYIFVADIMKKDAFYDGVDFSERLNMVVPSIEYFPYQLADIRQFLRFSYFLLLEKDKTTKERLAIVQKNFENSVSFKEPYQEEYAKRLASIINSHSITDLGLIYRTFNYLTKHLEKFGELKDLLDENVEENPKAKPFTWWQDVAYSAYSKVERDADAQKADDIIDDETSSTSDNDGSDNFSKVGHTQFAYQDQNTNLDTTVTGSFLNPGETETKAKEVEILTKITDPPFFFKAVEEIQQKKKQVAPSNPFANPIDRFTISMQPDSFDPESKTLSSRYEDYRLLQNSEKKDNQMDDSQGLKNVEMVLQQQEEELDQLQEIEASKSKNSMKDAISGTLELLTRQLSINSQKMLVAVFLASTHLKNFIAERSQVPKGRKRAKKAPQKKPKSEFVDIETIGDVYEKVITMSQKQSKVENERYVDLLGPLCELELINKREVKPSASVPVQKEREKLTAYKSLVDTETIIKLGEKLGIAEIETLLA